MTMQFLGGELHTHENTQDALFHIIPCGLEKTVSYGKGTHAGPQAILAASQQLERMIENAEPCLHGIFTHAPIDCTPPIEDVLAGLRERVHHISSARKIPVTLGGEHSLSYGAVMGVHDTYVHKGEPLGFVQIDAHADFRTAYQGHKYSHASVMGMLAREGFPICSLGVRQVSRIEDTARTAHGVIAYDAARLVREQISHITLPADFPHNIYVSFDLDGLDSSIMSATGTPVPGGLGFYQSLDLVRSCLEGRMCVGIDVVELAPIPHRRDAEFAAAMITYALMAMA